LRIADQGGARGGAKALALAEDEHHDDAGQRPTSASTACRWSSSRLAGVRSSSVATPHRLTPLFAGARGAVN